MDGGYAAYDGGGGSSFAFVEEPPQMVRASPAPPPAPPPQMQQQQAPQQQPQQPQQPQQQYQAAAPQGYGTGSGGTLSSPQAQAERQAIFAQMQEHLQMQQEAQQSGLFSKCWQRRKEVLKLSVMALVVVLALSTHSVVVYYTKTYLEDASLTQWREFMVRLAYPLGTLLILWGIKGAQAHAQRG